MRGKLFAAFCAVGLGLALSACDKYEQMPVFDSNCSGNGGLYDASFCETFVAGGFSRQYQR